MTLIDSGSIVSFEADNNRNIFYHNSMRLCRRRLANFAGDRFSLAVACCSDSPRDNCSQSLAFRNHLVIASALNCTFVMSIDIAVAVVVVDERGRLRSFALLGYRKTHEIFQVSIHKIISHTLSTTFIELFSPRIVVDVMMTIIIIFIV